MDLILPKLKQINILLVIIIFAGFVIRAQNINYNSPFLDEAIYILRGLKNFEGNIDEVVGDISWVGGFPFFYPLISSAFYLAGGIVASRFFSVILGTICIALIYIFTKRLGLFDTEKSNTTAGLIAAAFMSTAAVPISTSRIAIYDGLSFTLFTFGIILLHKAIYSGEERWYLITSLALFLSFLAKYITAMFFPFLLLLPLLLAAKLKNSQSIAGIVKSFWLPLIGATSFYTVLNLSSLVDFFSGQTNNGGSYGEVLRIFWEYSSIIFLLGLAASYFLWKSRKILVGVLLSFSTIPIFVHTLTRNNSSAQQHSFFTLLFLFPLAGALFALIISKYKKIGVAAAVITVMFNFLFAVPQEKQLESFWPNSEAAVKLLTKKSSANDIILAEADDVIMLGLYNKLSAQNIAGPFYFEYKGMEGQKAYSQAIDDKYFRFIELEGTYFSQEQINNIEAKLPGKYSKIYDDGTIRIYERNL